MLTGFWRSALLLFFSFKNFVFVSVFKLNLIGGLKLVKNSYTKQSYDLHPGLKSIT